MATLFIGLSGFSYKEWQGEGLFYPPKLKAADYLAHYATRYNALESVGSFTRTPSEATIAKWIATTPEGFRIAPKMHQKVTHFTRLKPDGDETLAYFVEALVPLHVAGKLGPILVQLPPNMKRDDERLAGFLDRLPRRTEFPWAFEFRHESWHCDDIEALLRASGIAWAMVETDEAPAEFRSTAAFDYIRLRKLAYSEADLDRWASEIRSRLSAGRDCYVFGRHAEVESPWISTDALRERVLVG